MLQNLSFEQVRKSELKNFISFWNRTKMSQQQCYIMKSYTGASTIYSYERRLLPTSCRKYCRRFLNKYYLKSTDDEYYDKFKSTRIIPLFIPQTSYIGTPQEPLYTISFSQTNLTPLYVRYFTNEYNKKRTKKKTVINDLHLSRK